MLAKTVVSGSYANDITKTIKRSAVVDEQEVGREKENTSTVITIQHFSEYHESCLDSPESSGE